MLDGSEIGERDGTLDAIVIAAEGRVAVCEQRVLRLRETGGDSRYAEATLALSREHLAIVHRIRANLLGLSQQARELEVLSRSAQLQFQLIAKPSHAETAAARRPLTGHLMG